MDSYLEINLDLPKQLNTIIDCEYIQRIYFFFRLIVISIIICHYVNHYLLQKHI